MWLPCVGKHMEDSQRRFLGHAARSWRRRFFWDVESMFWKCMTPFFGVTWPVYRSRDRPLS